MAFDWQTVVVTVAALTAAGVVLRRFLPKRRKAGASAAPACDHCEPTIEAPKRTQTTPVISISDLRSSAKRR
jgi:hypothetical protein